MKGLSPPQGCRRQLSAVCVCTRPPRRTPPPVASQARPAGLRIDPHSRRIHHQSGRVCRSAKIQTFRACGRPREAGPPSCHLRAGPCAL
eukprot:1196365-Prorocentrum_minimum.AAC.8